MGRQRFLGSVEVGNAKSNSEAVNLRQVKDLINRYVKETVRVATVGELTGEYQNGTITLEAPVTEIDGVTLVEGDRILVKDQIDKTQNGVYVFNDGVTFTRSEDCSEKQILMNNTIIPVSEGTVNADTKYVLTSDGTLTIGTSNLIFVRDITAQKASINVAKGEIDGDGSTKSFNVSHNHDLTDPEAYILIIKDKAGNDVITDNAPTNSNESNSITVTFAAAPSVGEKFKVFVVGLE